MSVLMTRRRFQSLLAAAAIGLPAASALGQDKSPAKGGTLRVVLQETASSTLVDPTRAASFAVYFAYELVGSRLVNITEQFEPVPALAESWEPVNGDVSDWRVTLRKGVQFHNGKGLTPQDVIYTLNRHRDPANKSSILVFVAHIDDVTAEGDFAVRIRLKRPDADFPFVLANERLFILPDGFEQFDKPMGTGPFMADGIDPAGVNTYKRNPNYWEGDGKPYLDAVTFFGNQDPIARVSALLAGDVDAAQAISFALAARVAGQPGFDVVSTASGVHNTVAMHLDYPGFDKLEARQAMKYLFDREQLKTNLAGGYAAIGNDHPVPPFSPYYHKELPVRGFDPDRARSLLASSGAKFPDGLTLHSSDAVTPGVAVDLARIFTQGAAQAGLSVQPLRDPVAGYWDNVWLKQPLVIGGWRTRFSTDAMFRLPYYSSSASNETRFNRPQFDTMMDAAVATADEGKRRQIYWDMQEMLYNEGGAVIPLFFNSLDAKSSRLQGLLPTPLGALSGWSLAGAWMDQA